MFQLVNGDEFPISREYHGAKQKCSDSLHRVNATTSKENVIVQGGIDDLDVNQDHFSYYLYRNILKQPLRLGWETIIGSKGDRKKGRCWGA
jgi:hypothetical protein